MRMPRFKRLAPACLLATSLAVVAGGVFASTAGAKAPVVEKPSSGTVSETGSTLALPTLQPLVLGLYHEIPRS